MVTFGITSVHNIPHHLFLQVLRSNASNIPNRDAKVAMQYGAIAAISFRRERDVLISYF